MSRLDTLYANLSYYNSKVSYWSTSASQYSSQISSIDGELSNKRRQRAQAGKLQCKINELSGANTSVRDSLRSMGSTMDQLMGESSAVGAAQSLCAPNDGHISEAQSGVNSLIARLDREIAELEARRATAVEGLNYSNNMASRYAGYASSTRTSIANYHE